MVLFSLTTENFETKFNNTTCFVDSCDGDGAEFTISGYERSEEHTSELQSH